MKKLTVIAGPNGAGKTTAAELMVPQLKDIREFVNADKIAAGLSPYNAEAQAMQAGRLMLGRLHQLLKKGENVIFETTLATRGFTRLLKASRDAGYETTLLYFWLPSADFAVQRVAARVAKGGHAIPESDIRRRYDRSLDHLFTLYWLYFDRIKIYDGSQTPPELIAHQNGDLNILNEHLWKDIKS